MARLRPIRGGALSPADRLILDAATGARRLTPDELQQVLEHVARAGFHPTVTVNARTRLANLLWRGHVLKASDQLGPAEEHFLWHVVKRQEWPPGTSLSEYLESICRVILDPTSGVFTNRYMGQWSLGSIRESRELRGPKGHDWILVRYRVDWGHWTTAFQPEKGLNELRQLEWSSISMATSAEAQQRAIGYLETIGLMLADLPDVAEEWESLPAGVRDSWSIDWGAEMSRLERLAQYAVQGLLTAEQRERYRQLTQQVREAMPLLKRLSLRCPRIPTAERPARSA